MKQLNTLKKKQILLKENISARLDGFLIGTVASSPSMAGHNLTTKVNGKTVTLHVRKGIVTQALAMSKQYKELWAMVQELSGVNWQILKLENPK